MNLALSLEGAAPVTHFAVSLEDPLQPGAPAKWTGLCESHNGRWSLLAVPAGERTHLVAMRSEFLGETTPVPRAIPIAEAGAASSPTAAPTAAPAIPPGRTGLSVPVMPAPTLTPATTASVVPAAPASTSPATPASASNPRAGQPLDLYTGEWVGQLTGRKNSRVRVLCNWNKAGTEVRRDSRVDADPGGVSQPVISATVMRFDELTGKYHSQIVAAPGAKPSVAEGHYDPATRTFTWTAVNDLDGATMVTKATFPQDGVQEWTQTVRDRSGTVISQGGGRNVRERK
jgi:hypothetical protein